MRKILLGISLTGVAIFVVAMFSSELGICPSYSYSSCQDMSNQVGEILIPIVALFILSFVIYWTREEVYRTWFRFARWWVPVSMVLIFITPEYGGGLFNPIQKGSVAFITSALFVVISLVIIVWKFSSTRPAR